ncbi:hypothetical protein [Aquimarina macrocephali]|uniref:hypothetical protein n=1 Tax=Aquimarina macrocephali TaxID=666563 RepID=UPI00046664DD|nr:hypothetical protein [Aquimarina macrocephali]
MKKAPLFIIIILFTNCSIPSEYDSHMRSVSEKGYGVIVTKITQHDKLQVPVNAVTDTIRMYPSIPGSYDNTTSLRNSKQIPKSKLPNYLTFEYQYIQMCDCAGVSKSKTVNLIYIGDSFSREKGDIEEVSQETADFYLKRGKSGFTLASLSNKKYNEENILKQYEKELKVAKVYYQKYKCKTQILIDALKFTKTVDLRPYKNSKEIKKFRKRNRTAAGSYYTTRITYQFYDNGEIKLALENSTTNPWK